MKDDKNEKENNVKLNEETPIISNIKPATDIADSIASILVNKIISDAVVNSKINEINKTMNDHCFDFLTKLINPYLNNQFIFYENGKEDLKERKNEFFFCSKPMDKINSWTVLSEPKSSEVDRCANTKTKLVKYKKYTDLKDDGLKESSFALDAEEDIKNINREHNVFDENENRSNYNLNIKSRKDLKFNVKNKNSTKNATSVEKEKKKEKDKDKENEKKNIKNNTKNEDNKKEKEKEIKKQVINRVMTNNNNSPKKKEKEEVLELSVVNDLPVEAYENKYSLINSNEENERLRREREIEIQKKQENKIIEKERQDKRNRLQLMRRMEKPFDSNRLTFDPDGKVINIRSHNVDNLEGGFVFSKLRIKTQKKNQKSTINLIDIVYPIEGLDQNQINENKNESMVNTRRSTLKGKEYLSNKIESDLSKIKVEKNEEDNIWNKNNNNNKNKKDKKESVLPSGANFEKIIPEVGVIVTGENAREVKEGGFDYVKKYNKPSFNELSKFISESINLNSNYYSSLMNSHNDINKTNNNSINNYLNNDRSRTEENNYIGYKEEFNDNNPLIQNAHNIKYYSPSGNRYNNISLNKSNINDRKKNLIKSYDRPNIDNSQYNSIQLSHNLNTLKLTNIFDDGINNSNSPNMNKYAKEVDNIENLNYLERAVLPFKNLRYKKENGVRKLIDIGNENNNIKEYKDQAYINKFNSQIVNNKMWGKEDDDIYKMQEKLNREMKSENENKSLFRKQRNNNRMKNFGMQIMTEGTNKRERKVPLFGGNIK